MLGRDPLLFESDASPREGGESRELGKALGQGERTEKPRPSMHGLAVSQRGPERHISWLTSWIDFYPGLGCFETRTSVEERGGWSHFFRG